MFCWAVSWGIVVLVFSWFSGLSSLLFFGVALLVPGLGVDGVASCGGCCSVFGDDFFCAFCLGGFFFFFGLGLVSLVAHVGDLGWVSGCAWAFCPLVETLFCGFSLVFILSLSGLCLAAVANFLPSSSRSPSLFVPTVRFLGGVSRFSCSSVSLLGLPSSPSFFGPCFSSRFPNPLPALLGPCASSRLF